eukprot:scaffold74816_cov44-Phaeocystis_antarctica.AAC.1
MYVTCPKEVEVPRRLWRQWPGLSPWVPQAVRSPEEAQEPSSSLPRRHFDHHFDHAGTLTMLACRRPDTSSGRRAACMVKRDEMSGFGGG